MTSTPQTRDGANNAVHKKLRRIVEKRQRSHLWTPADAINFVPRLLPTIYGDGRALFKIATINQRPAYWIIRACSTWGSGMDREDSPGPDFAEMTDDILTVLESAFGNGRCGYSGNSLFCPKKDRIQHCQCEECADPYVAKWPEVDGNGGCSWSRMDWPRGFKTISNPLSRQGNLLAATSPLSRPKLCIHEAIISLDGKWHCQKCGDAIEMATAYSHPSQKHSGEIL